MLREAGWVMGKRDLFVLILSLWGRVYNYFKMKNKKNKRTLKASPARSRPPRKGPTPQASSLNSASPARMRRGGAGRGGGACADPELAPRLREVTLAQSVTLVGAPARLRGGRLGSLGPCACRLFRQLGLFLSSSHPQPPRGPLLQSP